MGPALRMGSFWVVIVKPFLEKVCGRGFTFASTFGDDHWVDVALLVLAAAMLDRGRERLVSRCESR